MQKSVVATATLLVCLFTLFMQGYAQKKSAKRSIIYKPAIINYPADTMELEKEDGTFEKMIVQRNPDTVYTQVDVMPEFYGGASELSKFLADNIKYPEAEAKSKTEGKVVLTFMISKDGRIKNIKAVRTPTNGANLVKEAIRVVNSMPKWKPGSHNGKPVNVEYFIPIDFKLK